MSFELFNEIWNSAKRNKLRTALTGFAVAWGIFMIIFLLGSGNGLINAQTEHMDRYIANSMQVFGGRTAKPYNGLKEGREIVLKDKDITLSRKSFPQTIDKLGGEILERGVITMSYGQNYLSPTVRGVAPEYLEIEKYELLHGRFINSLDMKEQRKVIVISRKMAKELCNSYTSLLGKHIKLNNFAFKVIGIYKEDESQDANRAFCPFTTFKTMYGKGDIVGSIIFTVNGLDDEQQSKDFEKSYRSVINKNHQAATDDESSIWIWNRNSDSIQMNTGINIIRTALWIIGLLTLLSGIVGVSNIMLITVKERTREFGIRKAIGAKPLSILKLIITESVIITTLFGYIGMLAGILANEWMNITMGQKSENTGIFDMQIFINPTVGLDVCINATLVIIIAGTIAGIIPAWKAARIRPIEALRGE